MGGKICLKSKFNRPLQLCREYYAFPMFLGGIKSEYYTGMY